MSHQSVIASASLSPTSLPPCYLLESPHTPLVSMKSFYRAISRRKLDIQSNIFTRASLAEEWGTLNNLLTHGGEQRVKHEESMSGKYGARVLANLLAL